MNPSGGSPFVSNTEENSHSSEILSGNASGFSSSLARIRCLCGIPIFSEQMVECEDPRCRGLQHSFCVLIPGEQAAPAPPQFYCEICRINRADPFWEPVAQALCPVKFSDSGTRTNGENQFISVTHSFYLGRSATNLLRNTEYNVQVWCILLNDRVPFRIQWPLFAKLLINGIEVQIHNRPNTHPLGANGRDDGPLVKTCTRQGANTISLSGCDSRIFSFGVRVVKRLTLEQVLDWISSQQDGEKWEDALARVRRCIGGGAAAESTDSDLEVVMESLTVSMRCPMNGSRIRIAGRFKPCTHIGCFDLETFVQLTETTRKWQCPTCLKNYSLENICNDLFFSRITSMMQHCEDDVTEVEIKPDGCWRVKDETKCTTDIAQWHFPDGTLHGDRLKDDIKLESSVGELPEKFRCFCNNIDSLSSSLAINGRDVEYQSSRHDTGGLSALAPIMGSRHGSASHFDNDVRLPDNPSASSAGTEMIILSDSDDENEKLVSGAVYPFGQAALGKTFQNVPSIGGWDSRLADFTSSGTICHPYSNYSYNNNNCETLYSTLASSSSVSSQFLETGLKAIGSGANPHERSSTEYRSKPNNNILASSLNISSSRPTSDILQSSVSNTSYTQASTSLDNYDVASYLRNIERSNTNCQLGESNSDNYGQWSSLSVGSNLCHGVTDGLSAENVRNLGNQFSAVEVAMSCPKITGLPSSLNDHMFDRTAYGRGTDNTLYFSHQRANAPVHSYCTQQPLRPCFIPTASIGNSVDSTRMMQPVDNSVSHAAANLVHGFPTNWARQQIQSENQL
ncbi:hypothetical protein ACH5RR_004760 [Cinchona calisaya]|uniref:SP-RING-type domain-containing protein n=1 Tax=Cinchona calisaya TaxID=153742 RepID=A0ABD3AZA5_9GENT